MKLLQQALNFLRDGQIERTQNLLGFGLKLEACKEVAEISVGALGLIITDSEESREKILNYFKENEEFEYEYLSEDFVITFEEFRGYYDCISTKFEPNYNKFAGWAAENSVVALIIETAHKHYW